MTANAALIERLRKDGAACLPDVAPDWLLLDAADALAAADAEIARLRDRLEIDLIHPYDGIACRDETIRQQDRLRDESRREVEALRLVMKEADVMRYVMSGPVGGIDGMTDSPYECCRRYDIARAAIDAARGEG